MTRRQVWRYRCDFCGRSSCSGSGISRHEKHCTKNPDRLCRVCRRLELVQKPIAELKAAFALDLAERDGHHTGVEHLRVAASECPVCMLAAIRQTELPTFSVPTYGPFDSDDPTGPELTQPIEVNFNFTEELKAAWQTVNEADPHPGYDGGY